MYCKNAILKTKFVVFITLLICSVNVEAWDVDSRFYAFSGLHSSMKNTEWRLKDMGTLERFNFAEVIEFNDNGHCLIKGKLQSDTDTDAVTWGSYNEEFGFLNIDTSSTDPKKGNSFYRINGEGTVIGLRNSIYNKNPRLDLLTWTPDIGLKSYNLPVYNHPKHKTLTYFAKCRNSNEVVVSCTNLHPNGDLFRSEVYFLKNNQVVDLAPVFSLQANDLGFDGDRWVILSVNSTGTILGRFDNFELNPYKNTKAYTGRKYFLFDNGRMTVLEGVEKLLEWFGTGFLDGNHISVDSTGRVLIYTFVKETRSWESWIWSPEEGLHQIGGGHMRGLGLLDDGTIFWSITGTKKFNGFLFDDPEDYINGFNFPSENCQCLFLPLDNGRQLLPELSNNYKGVKVKTSPFYGTWPLPNGLEVNANTRKQIFFNGELFGETHPFLIEYL